MIAASISAAQRFVPSAGRVQALLTHRAVPAAATVAALLWLCWGLAQGTWRVLQPTPPAVAGSGGGDPAGLCALTRRQPFGHAAAKGAEVGVAATNAHITGTGAR